MVPSWDRCTTHFRTYFSGDWDVHWGTIWVLTHSQVNFISHSPVHIVNPKALREIFGEIGAPDPHPRQVPLGTALGPGKRQLPQEGEPWSGVERDAAKSLT